MRKTGATGPSSLTDRIDALIVGYIVTCIVPAIIGAARHESVLPVIAGPVVAVVTTPLLLIDGVGGVLVAGALALSGAVVSIAGSHWVAAVIDIARVAVVATIVRRRNTRVRYADT